MSREIVERLEKIVDIIPRRYRPKLKQDNVFDDEYYIDLDHNTYIKITIDMYYIVLHRHHGLWRMFAHPPDKIRLFETCDGNDWKDELLDLLNN